MSGKAIIPLFGFPANASIEGSIDFGLSTCVIVR